MGNLNLLLVRMIEAIIFDHDGVIVNTEPLHVEVWKEFFKQKGEVVTDEDLEDKALGKTEIDVIKTFIKDKTEAKYEELLKERRKLFHQFFEKNFTEIPGVKDFINSLKETKLKVGAASSSPKDRVEYSLDRLDVRDIFQTVVTAERVKKGKPDPEIYLLAAEELGVDPTNCLVFEDSGSGVKSAKAAGMKVILVKTSLDESKFSEGFIDGAVDDFSDLDIKSLVEDV
jgi:beta-phosphoglucomutase family hydrolase